MKKLFISLSLLLVFFAMLVSPQLTKAAALDGLNLWFFTLVPTLLPFMIISSAIMGTGGCNYISFFLKPVMKYLFHLPPATGYPFFIGLLCGFPMGSKITAEMVESGQISKNHGEILLTFCNNISPAFLVSYLVSYVLKLSGINALAIITIMLLSPIISGIMLSRLIGKSNASHNNHITYESLEKSSGSSGSMFDSCIIKSFENVIKLGGYIILFTIFFQMTAAFVKNPFLYSVTGSILEITSGLDSFCSMACSPSITAAACALTSFGGLCSVAQTYSMISGTGLRLGIYVLGKLFNCAVTFIMINIYFLLFNK